MRANTQVTIKDIKTRHSYKGNQYHLITFEEQHVIHKLEGRTILNQWEKCYYQENLTETEVKSLIGSKVDIVLCFIPTTAGPQGRNVTIIRHHVESIDINKALAEKEA